MAIRRQIRLDQVREAVGLSDSTIYRRMKDKDNPFPAARRVGSASLWFEDEIEAWQASLPVCA